LIKALDSYPKLIRPSLSSPSMSSPSLSSSAMSTPAKSSVNVQSCNVHPRFYSSVNVQSYNFSQPPNTHYSAVTVTSHDSQLASCRMRRGSVAFRRLRPEEPIAGGRDSPQPPQSPPARGLGSATSSPGGPPCSSPGGSGSEPLPPRRSTILCSLRSPGS